jgi:hypothetical protein
VHGPWQGARGQYVARAVVYSWGGNHLGQLGRALLGPMAAAQAAAAAEREKIAEQTGRDLKRNLLPRHYVAHQVRRKGIRLA